MRTIVLASSSPRRQEILSRTRLPFVIDVGDYDEDLSINLGPSELVVHLALGKVRVVASRHPDALIIGSDTVVAFEGVIFGKPHTSARAKEMLQALSGKTNSVVCAYAVLDTESGRVVTDTMEVRVTFRSLQEYEIDAYIATGEPLDKAGAYGIQGMGGIFIEKIEGDYPGALGLPLYSLMRTLKAEFGIDPFSH
ncbi:MAG: nucleoside triphosphate pyrophosphatase [Patescibacteria group bacterium]